MRDSQTNGGGVQDRAAPRPAILADRLVRRFGTTLALDGVDLQVAAGEIYGFLGPNGAGKSTVIRILCTLLRPSGGRAMVAGRDVASEPSQVRLRIGVALQDAALDERLTGRELLELQGRLYGLRGDRLRRRVDEILDLVGVGAVIERRIGTYSGGTKRRVDLAAALVHQPEVLFLDEPTTGLDPESRARVWSEVQQLNSQTGITVFLTTQYLEEADALAHRVGILTGGRIVAEASPRELKETVGSDLITVEVDQADGGLVDHLARLPTAELVSAHGRTILLRTWRAAAVLPDVIAAVQRHGRHLTDLVVRAPTLDDVFRQLTSHANLRQAAS